MSRVFNNFNILCRFFMLLTPSVTTRLALLEPRTAVRQLASFAWADSPV
jgi:hypothetical protein